MAIDFTDGVVAGPSGGNTSTQCYYGAIQDWVDDCVGQVNASILLDPNATFDSSLANASTDDAPNSANPFGFSNNQMALWYSWGTKCDADIDAAMRGKTLIVPITVGGVALNAMPASNGTRAWFTERWAELLTLLAYRPRIIASTTGANSLSDGDKAILKLVGNPIAEVTAAANGDVDPGADKVQAPAAKKANSAISTNVARRPYVPGISRGPIAYPIGWNW